MVISVISIIVPVYNAQQYIRKTVEMVLKQTFQDFELLLVEDCSKDESKKVLQALLEEKQDDRLILLENDKNMGAAASRNRGLQAAKGRYIAFLDADDVWMPDRLEVSFSFMRQKQAGFVFSAYEFGDENGKGTGKIVEVPEKLTYKEALSRTVIFTTTTLFDTEVIDKKLLEMPLVPSEDTATWWQILRNGHTAYGINRVLAIYTRPAQSLSSNKWKAMMRIWNLYRKIEKLPLIESIYHFCFWAYRATIRRI